MNRKKSKDGRYPLVYSTDPDFVPPGEDQEPVPERPPAAQRLRVRLDSRHRKGKTVTLVEGFEGGEEALQALGKALKAGCGSGGTVKDGLVLIQGDYAGRVKTLLQQMGYGLLP